MLGKRLESLLMTLSEPLPCLDSLNRDIAGAQEKPTRLM